MTKHEQIYALFVEANPYPDIESLPETFEEARAPLHAVGTPLPTEHGDGRGDAEAPSSARPSWHRGGRLAMVAAAIVIVVGASVVVARSQAPTTLPASTETAVGLTDTEMAMAFISLLEAGNVDGAEALLADPIDAIWFPPIGRVSESGQVGDYLEFYAATGVETELADCVGTVVGPLTEVTCHASQTAGDFAELGLVLPPFDMKFVIQEDGIQRIGSEIDDPQRFDVAFGKSRLGEFRENIIRPLGLVQSNGDPVWSRENGERMHGLIDEFLSDTP